MNTTSKIFYIIGAFFLVVGIAYGILTHGNEPMGIEPVGAIALPGAFAMSIMIALYTGFKARSFPGRPEDTLTAEVDDEAGVQGSFAPYSWWPLWAALGAALVFLGVAAGRWLASFGFILAMYGVIGWVLEFSRGQHAH